MIKSIRRASNEEWDRIVDSVGSAIYFQTREWFDIWAEYVGFENDTKLISLEGGKEVLLPLTRRTLLKGLIKVQLLAPKGMGGFLTGDELSCDEKKELFDILQEKALLYCAVNPYDELTNEFDRFNGVDYTQVLDLTQGFEATVKTWSRGHCRAIRKGIRQGITVELAQTETNWKAYFELYQDSLTRWNEHATNHYQWGLFEIMYKKKSSKIKLWLARYQGQIISGAICFYHNKRVAYWHGASSQQFFKTLNSSHVLHYYVIKEACKNGYLLYDFLPSSGIEGVSNFKQRFSPRKKPVNIYMSPLMKIFDAIRKKSRKSNIYKSLMKNTGF